MMHLFDKLPRMSTPQDTTKRKDLKPLPQKGDKGETQYIIDPKKVVGDFENDTTTRTSQAEANMSEGAKLREKLAANYRLKQALLQKEKEKQKAKKQ